MTAPSTNEAPPKSLAALVRLCESRGDITVTRADSLKANNCQPGTDIFIEKYLGGRSEVSLTELIPFIRSRHDYWWIVKRAIREALIRQEVFPDTEEVWSSLREVPEPSRKRQVTLQW